VSGWLANPDWVRGLAGGMLIGLGGATMLLGAGRIAGVSGLAARALGLAESDMAKSSAWMFLLGLPLGAALVAALGGPLDYRYAPLPLLIAAGLLVGIGTRVGSGCTSGHGVCGVSRLSQRSLVATATFIVAGIATVFAMRVVGASW